MVHVATGFLKELIWELGKMIHHEMQMVFYKGADYFNVNNFSDLCLTLLN